MFLLFLFLVTMPSTKIAAMLLAPATYSKEHIKTAADYAAAAPAHFSALITCFLSDEYRLVQRAAGALSHAARLQPSLITPYLPQIVAQLQRKNAPDAVVRNCARILEETDLPVALHGEVMNTCFELVTTPATAAAIKAFSLTILYNLSLHYPEIGSELQVVIEEQWETETAAFRSRGKKILEKLKKRSNTASLL